MNDSLLRQDRNHTADIIVAGVAFAVTNLVVIGVSNAEVFSLPAMLLRFVVLGIPAAVILWKWYRLMHTFDPDYGELWQTYWTSQVWVWTGLLMSIILLLVLIILLGMVGFLTLKMMAILSP